jgi:acetyl esterase
VGCGAAAVFPVYDLAPEAKYPTQVEQNYAVAQWIMREGAGHALDATRFAVCGDSSGGGMSAVLALMAKERGDVGLAAQVLLYPTTDANFETSFVPAVRRPLLQHARGDDVVLGSVHA